MTASTARSRIPASPELNALLADLRVEQPTELTGYSSDVVIPPRRLFDEKAISGRGAPLVGAAVELWWPRHEQGMQFASLVQRVSKALEFEGHAADRELTILVLWLCTKIAGRSLQTADVLARVLASVRDADVSQFYVLMASPDAPSSREYNLRSFRLGRLDLERLEHRCKRARSDYFQRYGELLRNKPALERKPFKYRAISWADVMPIVGRATDELEYYVVFEYFERLADLIFDQSWMLYREEQSLLVAAGAPTVDDDMLRSLPGSHGITIFLKHTSDGGGWVSPSATTFTIDLAAVERQSEEINSVLRGVGVADAEALNPTVHAYARMIARGVRHGNRGALDEGFLHLVIALDLLFGEDGRSTQSIAHGGPSRSHSFDVPQSNLRAQADWRTHVSPASRGQ